MKATHSQPALRCDCLPKLIGLTEWRRRRLQTADGVSVFNIPSIPDRGKNETHQNSFDWYQRSIFGTCTAAEDYWLKSLVLQKLCASKLHEVVGERLRPHFGY